MSTQLVIISPEGKEVDWYDPIVSFEETETHWIVDNSYHVYRIHKNNYPGHTVEIRPLSKEN